MSETVCARDYGVTRRFTDWRALLAEKLDAVILTSGSHALPA